MPTKINTEILTAAIEGFQEQKKRIDVQLGEIRQMLDGRRHEASTQEAPPRKRKLHAAARRRMKEAQRRRWAKIKGQPAKESVAPAAPKKKRRLSVAGRRRIIEATKRRWALSRAERESATSPVSKKASRKSSVRVRARKEATKAAA